MLRLLHAVARNGSARTLQSASPANRLVSPEETRLGADSEEPGMIWKMSGFPKGYGSFMWCIRGADGILPMKRSDVHGFSMFNP